VNDRKWDKCKDKFLFKMCREGGGNLELIILDGPKVRNEISHIWESVALGRM